jgi:hypothetical protein
MKDYKWQSTNTNYYLLLNKICDGRLPEVEIIWPKANGTPNSGISQLKMELRGVLNQNRPHQSEVSTAKAFVAKENKSFC